MCGIRWIADSCRTGQPCETCTEAFRRSIAAKLCVYQWRAHPHRRLELFARLATLVGEDPARRRLDLPNSIRSDQVAVVIHVKDRLEHLKQSLPAVLWARPAATIVVDVACPQACGTWASETYGPLVDVVHYDPGDGLMYRCRAKNIGAVAALRLYPRIRTLLFLDADLVVKPSIVPTIESMGCSVLRVRRKARGGIAPRGAIACPADVFVRSGGFEEQFDPYWGPDDREIVRRLRQYVPFRPCAGLRREIPHLGSVRHQHDAVRTREGCLAHTADVWRRLCRQRVSNKAGWSYTVRLNRQRAVLDWPCVPCPPPADPCGGPPSGGLEPS